MKDAASLAAVLPSLPRVSVHGPWSRAIGYHLLQGPPPGAAQGNRPEPLWPGGAPLKGARLTPRGSFATIYLASDPVTALREVDSVFAHAHMPPMTLRTPPWVVFAVEGIVDEVLDVTKPAIQTALGTSLQELTGDWQIQQDIFLKGGGPAPPTQELGLAAFNTKAIRGIRYPSSKGLSDGACFAFFSERLDSNDFLEVYDPMGNVVDRRP